MQLFYSSDITPGSLCTLDPEESRHAVRVLRKREGDELHLTDGRGTLHRCLIVVADDRACLLESVGQDSSLSNSPFSIHLAIAPTKNPSRMEWLVEKAVEIGVGTITLLQCDHSERTFLKTERLQKIALNAMKQSLRTMLPTIHETVGLREWLRSGVQPRQRLIAHCEEGELRQPLVEAMKSGMETSILIGPEGDFSPEEIALALEQGFTPVSLGPSRLRTETAALYAVAAFNLINDRP